MVLPKTRPILTAETKQNFITPLTAHHRLLLIGYLLASSQGGMFLFSSTSVQSPTMVSFPIAFSTQRYAVVNAPVYSSAGNATLEVIFVDTKTTTSQLAGYHSGSGGGWAWVVAFGI